MSSAEQFLEVVDRDEAERRFRAALGANLKPLGVEQVPLVEALGRTLAADIVAPLDVPSFDRSNLDGFAVRAADTFGAAEERPRRLSLAAEVISSGVVPRTELAPQSATSIATGGMLPRGADAIVAIEHADASATEVTVFKPVVAGFGVTFAGTDIAQGEIVLRRGETLSSRETGVLAALGVAELSVWRRPRVAIVSTGDEILPPGEAMRPGMVFDSNAQILADAVRELGGEPLRLGIVADDLAALRASVARSLDQADLVLLSGGTSKGSGDLSYRVAAELCSPGIVAHGVALKPGKPICLAVERGKAVVVLPGFPTSAIFTFHEFVAPVILALAGRSAEQAATLPATLAVKLNSEIGRTEYVLVTVASDPATGRIVAYPMGKGSGSVTAFSRADGFVTIDRHQEIVEAGADVSVRLLGRDLRAADLMVIGSHCAGLDYLLGLVQDQGFRTKFIAVGSTAGLDAVARGECDLAGIHLLDTATGEYNQPFVTSAMKLVSGYRRLQGFVYRAGDARFAGLTAAAAIARAAADPNCLMINRNQGSGTRLLIDRMLGGAQPPGYAVQARNHNAVVAAVRQGRADWGVAISAVASHPDLAFLPLADEHYDFVVPAARLARPAVQAFLKLLGDSEVRAELERRDLRP